MHDIKDIRKRPDYYKQNLAVRGVDPDVIDKIIELDAKKRKLIGERQALAEEANKVTAAIGKAKQLEKEIEAGEKHIADLDKKCDDALLEALSPFEELIEKIVNELKKAEADATQPNNTPR